MLIECCQTSSRNQTELILYLDNKLMAVEIEQKLLDFIAIFIIDINIIREQIRDIRYKL